MSVKSASGNGWTVGIDDTDIPGVGGTGKLARSLVESFEERDIARSTGVTRHQLYEGSSVPKTARNSAAAIGFTEVPSPAILLEAVTEFVAEHSIPGSDPGVALGRAPVATELQDFAFRTQTELVTQEEVRHLAAGRLYGVVGVAGTEAGIIGAVAAVSLRIAGNDGRYVGLAGIRDVSGPTTVAELLGRTAVSDVIDEHSRASLSPSTEVDLGDWVRPRVIGGAAVLVARRAEGRWVVADARPK